MKGKKLQGSIVLTLSVIIALSFSSNPPNGRTGGPGEGFCTDCHSPPSSSIDGFLDISGIPAEVEANQTYTLTVTSEFTSGSPTRAGFQMTVLTPNNGDPAGTMDNNDGDTNITDTGDRIYLEHSPATNFNGATSISWSVDWTAPANLSEDMVGFYATTILANGNGDDSGDRMKVFESEVPFVIPTDPLSLAEISSTDVSCFGLNDGMAEFEASGGTPPYTYTWNNGETGPIAVALPAGWSEIFVADDNGEMTASSVFIDTPDEILLEVFETINIACFEEANGELTGVATGGSAPFSFLWSNGQTSEVAIDLAQGTYTLTVTDDNGCTASADFELFEPSEISFVEEEVLDISCGGTGQITALAEGGTGALSYNWSNGGTGPILNVDVAGLYTVSVTDGSNCELVSTYSISSTGSIEYNVNIVEINCFGDNDAAIELMITTPGNVTVQWSNGATGLSINNLSPGDYSATVTDDSGCSSIENIIINEPTQINTEIVASNEIFCSGELIDVLTLSSTGGNGPYAYTMNGIASLNGTFTNVGPGSYDFVTTDAFGCIDLQTIEYIGTNPLVANVTTSDPSIAGGNDGSVVVIVEGGTPPYVYNGAAFNSPLTVENLTEGMYVFAITDSNNCALDVSFNLSSPDCSLELMLDIVQPMCMISEFALNANVIGGTAPYTFDTPMVDSPGTYTASATDALGCTVSGQFTVAIQDSEAPVLSAEVFEVQLDENGAYSIMDLQNQFATDNCSSPINIQADLSLINCQAGSSIQSVPVMAIDGAGNVSQGFISLIINDLTPPTLFCLDDVITQQCEGLTFVDPISLDNCGVASVSRVDMLGEQLTIGENIIIYQAIDHHGNSTICEYMITVESQVEFEVEIFNASCAAAADGSYQIITSDTTSTVVYQNGEISGLTAGTYYFSVINGQSLCELADSIVITEPEVLSLNNTIIFNAENSNTMDGAIDIEIVGGTLPYSYEWIDEQGDIVSTEEDPSNLFGGLYTCSVTDANGCLLLLEPIRIDVTTSVSILPEHDMIMYPNPIEDQLGFATSLEIKKITLYDAQGKYLKEYSGHHDFIDLSLLTQGLYLIEVETKKHRFLEKLMKI